MANNSLRLALPLRDGGTLHCVVAVTGGKPLTAGQLGILMSFLQLMHEDLQTHPGNPPIGDSDLAVENLLKDCGKPVDVDASTEAISARAPALVPLSVPLRTGTGGTEELREEKGPPPGPRFETMREPYNRLPVAERIHLVLAFVLQGQGWLHQTDLIDGVTEATSAWDPVAQNIIRAGAWNPNTWTNGVRYETRVAKRQSADADHGHPELEIRLRG